MIFLCRCLPHLQNFKKPEKNQTKNMHKNTKLSSAMPALFGAAVTRIRTWVASATTKSTNHYTITAIADRCTMNRLSKLKIVSPRIFPVFAYILNANYAGVKFIPLMF